ncbi:MAG: serine/threonine-protein kinase [Fuerstiella sp.]|nr:serine/threonine protein kinase [Fuerstiella sp.]
MESQELVPGQTLTIIAQICEGLQFAHDEGVVHRDIKPEKILIDSRGNVKIADFGLAKLAEHSADNFTLTGTHQVMGTPRYMAPEQMGGSCGVDHRADIYSLGVVFYELLTGEVPMGQFEPPSKKTSVDARLDDVVLRALASEPERRFQSASELKSRVDAISSVAPNTTAEQPSETPPAARPGVSTIMEREAVAAWRWVAGEVDSTATDRHPELPALLMVLLSVVGCMTVLLPWIDVEILEAEAGAVSVPAQHVASAGTDIDRYSLCFWQVEATAQNSRASIAISERQHSFGGLDKWPGLTVCGTFALLALLLIALPPGHRRMVRWSLLMTLLAGLALLHTFLFKLEVDLSLVQIPTAQTRLADGNQRSAEWPVTDETTERAGVQTPQPHFVLFQTGVPVDSSLRLGEIDHRLTYRIGFFGALGLSITMLVLSATGIRHAIAYGGNENPGPKHPGFSLAHVHFSAHQSLDIGERIKSHFFELGYQLVQENATK